MLPHENVTEIDALKKFKSYFDYCDELLQLAVRMIDNASIKGYESEYSFAVVSLGLYAKACKTFRSIQILCSKPLGEDANSLLRTLMESCINLCYIAEDKQERSQVFINKIIKNSKRLGTIINSNKRLRKMNFIPEEGFRQAKILCKMIGERNSKDGIVKRIKVFLIEKMLRKQQFKISTWSGKSLQNMAYEVGLRDVYDLTGPLSSATLHGEDLLDHINFGEGKGFTLKIVPGDKWVNPVLPSAILIFITMMDKINTLFSLGKDKEMEDFLKRFLSYLYYVYGIKNAIIIVNPVYVTLENSPVERQETYRERVLIDVTYEDIIDG